MPNDKYQLKLQHISSAQSGMLTFDNSSFSNLCTNESEVELAWRFLGTTSAINASNITCYSNEEPICGLSSPCASASQPEEEQCRLTSSTREASDKPRASQQWIDMECEADREAA
nr:unnamed protein product [Spirometra erinaceieuropaei]